MSYLGKTYKHQKDEHFKEFLETLGVPEDRLQPILNSCLTQKLEKNGDEYVLTTTNGDKAKEIKFKNGVEFDENVSENVNAKTTFTIDGDVVKQVQKFPDGRSLFVENQYSDNELLVILKSNSCDDFARRYYTFAQTLV